MAGDPTVFPDQIQAGLRPWRPLKVYARVPFARVTDKGVYDYATHHWTPARVYDYVHDQWLPIGPANESTGIVNAKRSSLTGPTQLHPALERAPSR